MPSAADIFQAGAARIVALGGGGLTLRLRKFSDVPNPITRKTVRTLVYGPSDVPAMRYEEGEGNTYMIAKGSDTAFDTAATVNGRWTAEDGGVEYSLEDGVKGMRLDGGKTAWWLIRLPDTSGPAGSR